VMLDACNGSLKGLAKEDFFPMGYTTLTLSTFAHIRFKRDFLSDHFNQSAWRWGGFIVSRLKVLLLGV